MTLGFKQDMFPDRLNLSETDMVVSFYTNGILRPLVAVMIKYGYNLDQKLPSDEVDNDKG